MIGQLTILIPDDVIQNQHITMIVRLLMSNNYTKREAKLMIADLADLWEPEFMAHVQRRIDEWVAA